MCSECEEAQFQKLLLPDWSQIAVGCGECGAQYELIIPPEYISLTEVTCAACGNVILFHPIPEMLMEGVDDDD